jgi:hypothetical protein
LVFKSQENKIANTRNLGFLETTVHRVREKAENQGKTREKSKVAENQVFWSDFCAKKGLCKCALGGFNFILFLEFQQESNGD